MEKESIVVAGGCFWCIEAAFRRLTGVIECRSGYTGGSGPSPTYEEVCSGATGHAEAVKVTFDAEQVSLDEVLEFFWRVHDPTTRDRQGNDIGTQYRSAIFYRGRSQYERVVASIKGAQARFAGPIVTQVAPLGAFYPAEEYHRDYFERNRDQGYCRLVIEPKLAKVGVGEIDVQL